MAYVLVAFKGNGKPLVFLGVLFFISALKRGSDHDLVYITM